MVQKGSIPHFYYNLEGPLPLYPGLSGIINGELDYLFRTLANNAKELVSKFPNPTSLRIAAIGLYHNNDAKGCLELLEANKNIFPEGKPTPEFTSLNAKAKAKTALETCIS